MNDLISRVAFRNSIQTVLNDITCPIHIAAEIEQYLEFEPAVDAAPVVHGQWVEKRWITECDWCVINHRALVCTACSIEIADGEKTPYCPYCGAKMDEERRAAYATN